MICSGPITRDAAEAFGLCERRLDVRDLDVERDVAVVALGPLSDAAADPDAVGRDVPLALDDPYFIGLLLSISQPKSPE